MGESGSVDVILEFLRRNKLTRAEAALRSELCNRSDLNGVLEKLAPEEKDEANGGALAAENQGTSYQGSGVVVSKELIVKEIECGAARNGPEGIRKKEVASVGERSKGDELVGTSDKHFTFSKSLEDSVLDLYNLK